MDYDVLFSIGELARICNVTPKTLRYYGKLGLLKPAMVNPQNGYRFYTRWHITRVTAIRQLQDMGVVLDDIHTFFEQSDDENIMQDLSDLLELQKNTVNGQIKELSKRLKTIQFLQAQCEKIKGKIVYDESTGLIIRSIPERRVLYTSYHGKYMSGLFEKSYQEILSLVKSAGISIDEMELSGPLAIYETPRNMGDMNNVGIKFGYETGARQKLPLPTLLIEEGLYACYVYRGPYTCIKSELYVKLYEKIRGKGYQTLLPQMEYFYINEAIADSDENYLTEIQIPIKVIEN